MASSATPTPRVSPGNPGDISTFAINFEKGEESWDEQIDLTELLLAALQERDIPATRDEAWLRTGDGFWLLPQLVSAQLSEDGNMRTSTTIQAWHPELAPEGVFEYQHSISNEDAVSAFRRGFSQWAATDAVALRDSASDEPDCPCMIMEFPADDGGASLRRRVVLGPVAHYAESPAPAQDDEHPFCPCCLFTNSLDAFHGILRDGGYAAIRLYAARDANGEISADCRVNGEDYPAGQQALAEYVGTWPQRGFEFRKQLVIAHLYDGEPG